MIFKFKEKEIVLDCFTQYATVYEAFPIETSLKHMPDWWHTIPKEMKIDFFSRPTMKTCTGLLNLYKYSYTIPMWSDLAIQVSPDASYRWQFSDSLTEIDLHPSEQRGDFLPVDKFAHLKIQSPWFLSCKKSIKWVWSQPTYNSETLDDIIILPGVVDYYNQSDTNINFALNIMRARNIFVKAGQPMVHMTPMYDGKIKFVNHLISEQEMRGRKSIGLNCSFINSNKILNKFKEKAKCPYTG